MKRRRKEGTKKILWLKEKTRKEKNIEYRLTIEDLRSEKGKEKTRKEKKNHRRGAEYAK
ncbi:hypothetical protein ACFL6F_02535 [Planctomycetota bacterium]